MSSIQPILKFPLPAFRQMFKKNKWCQWGVILCLCAFSISCNVCHGEEGDSDNLVHCSGNVIRPDTNEDNTDLDITNLVNEDNISFPNEIAIPASEGVTTFTIFETEVTNGQYATFLQELKTVVTETADAKSNDCNLNNTVTALCYNFEGEGITEDKTIAKDGGKARVVANYGIVPDRYTDHPVTYVSWYGAWEYCKALGKTLPTVKQWRAAAGSAYGNLYPWGNAEPNPSCLFANAALSNDSNVYCKGDTVSVKDVNYANGLTREGLWQMAGNVSEWSLDKNSDNEEQRIVLGGGWDSNGDQLQLSSQRNISANSTLPSVGFRCVSNN